MKKVTESESQGSDIPEENLGKNASRCPRTIAALKNYEKTSSVPSKKTKVTIKTQKTAKSKQINERQDSIFESKDLRDSKPVLKNRLQVERKNQPTTEKPELNEEKIQISVRRKDIYTYSSKINSLEQRSHLRTNLLLIFIILTICYSGYVQSIFNLLALPLTKHVYKFTKEEQVARTGMIYSLIATGYIFANLSISLFAKNFGRMRLFLVVEAAKIVACFLSTLQNFNLLLGLMVATGFLCGIQETLSGILIKEIFQPKIADLGGLLFYLPCSGFSLIASSTSLLVGGEMGFAKNWRILLAWPSLISIVALIGITWIYGCVETPQFYVETETDLKRMRRKIDVAVSQIFTKKATRDYIKYKFQELRKTDFFKNFHNSQKKSIKSESENQLEKKI